MILQIIKLKSDLPEQELLARAKDRGPQFEAIPGLLQKYYVKIGPSQYGGIYVWDNQESIDSFRSSELAQSIPQAYEIVEPPEIEMMDIMFQLRP